MQLFLEAKLPELQTGGVSNLTRNFLDLRHSQGDFNIVFNNAEYNKRENYFEVVFLAHTTFGATDYIDYGGSVQKPNVNNGKYYTLVLRFTKVKQVGFDKNILSKSFTEIEDLIRKAISYCDVRFYSDDPSWFYQGGWEIADKNNASVYKFPGPAGKGIWAARHKASGGLRGDIYLTKHLAQVVDGFESYIPIISQSIKVT